MPFARRLRIIAACLVAVAGHAFAGSAGAQQLQRARVAARDVQSAHWPTARTSIAGAPRMPVSPERRPYVLWGAVIGGTAGTVYAVNDACHGPSGCVGSVVLVPFGLLAGLIAGGAIGYLVSVIVHPR